MPRWVTSTPPPGSPQFDPRSVLFPEQQVPVGEPGTQVSRSALVEHGHQMLGRCSGAQGSSEQPVLRPEVVQHQRLVDVGRGGDRALPRRLGTSTGWRRRSSQGPSVEEKPVYLA